MGEALKKMEIKSAGALYGTLNAKQKRMLHAALKRHMDASLRWAASGMIHEGKIKTLRGRTLYEEIEF